MQYTVMEEIFTLKFYGVMNFHVKNYCTEYDAGSLGILSFNKCLFLHVCGGKHHGRALETKSFSRVPRISRCVGCYLLIAQWLFLIFV